MLSSAARSAGVIATFALLAQPAADSKKPEPSVRQVGTMRTARAAHTATTLASGQVLLVGGMTEDGGSTANVELLDPAQNVISELGALAERRSGHTATLLTDGRVVIAGGYNGEYLASMELFDPSARRFRVVGSLQEERSGHTATLLPDGRVLFVCGVGRGWTFLRSAELFDPASGRAEPLGAMSVPREGHSATLLADGRVLIIGGHNGRRRQMEVHASAEIFDPRTRRFESAGQLATARHKHDAVRLTDGRVLVIGGADRSDRVHFATTEVYTPSNGAFEPGPSMANRRYKIAGTSILLPTGDVLVTSGAAVAELLDVDRWSFREVQGRFPAAYRFATAALLREGDVVIAGGYSDGNHSTAGVWRYGRPGAPTGASRP